MQRAESPKSMYPMALGRGTANLPYLALADGVQRLHTAARGMHVLREHRVRIQAGVGLGGAPGHPRGHTCGQEGGGVQGGGGNRVRQRR